MGAAQTVEKTYVLDASTLTPTADIATPTLYADYFTLVGSSGKKLAIDSNSKKNEDGTVSFTQRIKLGGKSTKEQCSISFTTAGAAVVTVYAYSSSSSGTDRTLSLYDVDFNEIFVSANPMQATGTNITPVVIEIEEAGTYYLGSSINALNIYYISVVVQEPAA